MRHALRRGLILVLAGMMLAMPFLANEASAHSPLFPQGNTNIEEAAKIPDAAVSYAAYASLGPGPGSYTQTNYYKLDLGAGDRLLLVLLCPVADYQNGFRAEMVLMGPGMNSSGDLPPTVQVWPGYGYQVFESEVPTEASYEGFSPSAFYDLYRFDGNVSMAGTYYVAITNPNPGGVGGNYGFAPGYKEEFTVPAAVTIPFALFQVYEWEGQALWFIILPWVAVVLLGSLYLLVVKRERFRQMSLMNLSVFIGGLWILATAAMTTWQFFWAIDLTGVVPEVFITMLFMVGQTALGLAILWQSFRVQRPPGVGRRAAIFCLGILGFAAWAGYIVGPVLVMVGALLPWKRKLGK
jgi:hypothetical protein